MVVQNGKICRICGEQILSAPPFMQQDEKLCDACSARQHYVRFGRDVLRVIRENKEACIRLAFQQLKKMPHGHIMNRLAKCRKPYAELMLIHFYGFSLVVVYDVSSVPVHNYLISNSYCGASMTEFKKSRWLGYDLEKQRTYFRIEDDLAETLHLWKQPYKIEAKTDRVSDYQKHWHGGVLEYEGNNWGDTESFYIVGVLYQ